MKIKSAPGFVQPLLFDVPQDKEFGTNGAARTHYGNTVQALVCDLLGLTEIPNSGNYDAVFDAQCPRTSRFFEIKSVHATNKIPLYVWRTIKDRESGVEPIYLFAVHRVRGAKNFPELRAALAKTFTAIYAVDSAAVEAAVASEPLRQIVKEVPNTRMGYQRKGYCDGYRNLPVSRVIRELATTCVRQIDRTVHGEDFKVTLFADEKSAPVFTYRHEP